MSTAQVAKLSADTVTIEERTPFQIVMNRFKRHRLAMVSLVVMIGIFIITILAPVIAPFEIQELSVNKYFVEWGTVDEATGRVLYGYG
jgi:peptide/nickel transport system permease protein